MTGWTDPAAVEAKVRRAWRSGDLLRAHAHGEPFPAIEVPLRGPSARELAERLMDARDWAARIGRASEDGARFDVETASVGGRSLGRTLVPAHARVRTYEQAWRILGVRADVAAFDRVMAASRIDPVRDWVLAHPLLAIDAAEEWPAILSARDWLDWNRGSELYLRQVDAPGVDTKLIGRRRGILAEMLGVPTKDAAFTAALGYREKPPLVRMRFDPELFGFPKAVTEAQLRVDEITRMAVRPSSALIIENEISYLSAPVPPRGVVLFGKGYNADVPASLTWLHDTAVHYWGDIDTHGFRILDRVRAHLPHTRSVLMDRETLLRHEERWGSETAAANARLSRLTDAESALYADLVSDRYAPSLRLEQERIDWAWVLRSLPADTL